MNLKNKIKMFFTAKEKGDIQEEYLPQNGAI
jgi:hypothetical protein